MYYVYTLTDPMTAQIFYVGKGKHRRSKHHLQKSIWNNPKTSSNPYLYSHIKRLMENNNIPIIQAGTFRHLGQLEILSLSANPLRRLTVGSFSELKKLKMAIRINSNITIAKPALNIIQIDNSEEKRALIGCRISKNSGML